MNPAELWSHYKAARAAIGRVELEQDVQDPVLDALAELKSCAMAAPITTLADAAARAEMAVETLQDGVDSESEIRSAEELAAWLGRAGK